MGISFGVGPVRVYSSRRRRRRRGPIQWPLFCAIFLAILFIVFITQH